MAPKRGAALSGRCDQSQVGKPREKSSRSEDKLELKRRVLFTSTIGFVGVGLTSIGEPAVSATPVGTEIILECLADIVQLDLANPAKVL